MTEAVFKYWDARGVSILQNLELRGRLLPVVAQLAGILAASHREIARDSIFLR